MDIMQALARVPLFDALPTSILEAIARTGETLRLAPGELICREGERGTRAFVVVEGSVRIFRTSDGEEVEIGEALEGELVGELAIFSERPRSASMMAPGPTTLFAIEKADLLDAMTSNPSRAQTLAIFGGLVNRVYASTERMVRVDLERRAREAEMEAERHRVVAELLAGVAHELNTPLGVANTGASILESRLELAEVRDALAVGPEARDALEDMREAAVLIQRNLARAHKLVESFKRVSVDHVSQAVDRVNLRTLIADIVELFRLRARRSGFEVVVRDQLPPEGATWMGSAEHLTQVISNLLLNAERHGYPEGGGGAELRLAADEEGFLITVEDAGVGISPEVLPRIFTPFFTTARDRGGVGIGLAIVRSSVHDALKGRIDVTSTLGEGTRFTVWIPRALEV